MPGKVRCWSSGISSVVIGGTFFIPSPRRLSYAASTASAMAPAGAESVNFVVPCQQTGCVSRKKARRGRKKTSESGRASGNRGKLRGEGVRAPLSARKEGCSYPTGRGDRKRLSYARY